METNPGRQGIWLEIAEVEFMSNYGETSDKPGKAAVVARFVADQAEDKPKWWRIAHIAHTEASKEYNRILTWLEKDRVLQGKFGLLTTDVHGDEVRPHLEIVAYRTKSARP